MINATLIRWDLKGTSVHVTQYLCIGDTRILVRVDVTEVPLIHGILMSDELIGRVKGNTHRLP